jgi:hypothetical protein
MKTILYILLIFAITNSYSQVSVEKVLKRSTDELFADDFDNFYILSDNILTKYDANGNKIANFSSENGSQITYIDCRNPQKVLVFFQNENNFILLDNELTKISNTISLNDFDVYGDALLKGAKIGGFWIYDTYKNQLIKINSNFKLEYKKDIKTNSKIISISDNSEQVFMLKNSGDLMSYNFNTGNQKELPVYKLCKNFKVIEDNIACYSGNLHSIWLQNYVTGEKSKIKLPTKTCIARATLGKNKIFFFNKNKVYISKTTKNK